MRRLVSRRVTSCGALPVIALALNGCTTLAPKGCTTVGGESGVRVTLAERWTTPLTVEVCVADRCSSGPSVQSTADPVFVPNAGVVSSRPTDVVLTVSDARGAPVFPAQRTTVVPTKYQPNGPDCDPTVWVAQATVTPSGLKVG